jgi:hypothetical protein
MRHCIRIGIITAAVLSLSGCGIFTKLVAVPQYQEIQIVHPEQPPSPTLNNPKIVAHSVAQLKVQLESEKPENIIYTLTQSALDALLADDINKLEYSQYETKRANFYKKAIEDFNAKVLERNEEATDK